MPKVAPQSVDFTMSIASVWPFLRSDCRNVTYTWPLAVTEMSGNCTSWATWDRLFGFDQVAP